MEIKDGMFVFINDCEVWYNVILMNKLDVSKEGYFDCFVLIV